MSIEIRDMKSFLGLREPISGISHLLGLCFFSVGSFWLLHAALLYGTIWHVISFSIFGGSLILLYASSTLYHSLRASRENIIILKRIDHMMIFVLIAGTYTPLCLVPLRGVWGWSCLAGIWGIALTGIFIKIFWLAAPRWISTAMYLLMGWSAMFIITKLVQALPEGALIWLMLGGAFYTLGAIMYAVKKPNIVHGVWEFHETWHLFVLAGSFCHFWMMYAYILYLR